MGAVKFDPHGGFLGLQREVFPSDNKGRKVEWKAAREGQVDSVTLVTDGGRTARVYQIPEEIRPMWASTLREPTRCEWTLKLSRSRVSPGGWTYIAAMRQLPKPRVIDLNRYKGAWGASKNDRTVGIDIQMMALVYRPDGKCAGQAVFDYHPFMIWPDGYTFDAAGNLYQIDFYGDRLGIARWRPSK